MLGMPGVPREELMRYMTETAEALDLMNKHYQIQHLDIKPQNLFLVFEHIKVADFGLAKAFEGIRATVTGGVTPVYAAPETFEGYVTRFSDQYSLSIVYQELLTGVRPFNGTNTKQLLLQHLRDAPDLRSLPEYDRDIIARGLSKNPNDRWPGCAEMVNKLRAAPTSYVSERGDIGALPLPNSDLMRNGPSHTPPPKPVSTSAPGSHTVPATSIKENRDPQTMTAATARAQGIPIGGSHGQQQQDPMTMTGQMTRPGAYHGGGGGISTPMPGLVTPRLVTPRAAAAAVGPAPAITLMRHQVVETGRMGALGIAPPEKTGDGVLFPALVIGIGQAGGAVLRRLRSNIRDRFGRVLPTAKFLYVDTDSEALAAATAGPGAFEQSEVVPARLNRPGHYLTRDGLPPIDTWLPPGLLYQLPKNPGPASGVRAFGRLAMMDNFRTIAQRIRQAIEPFLSEDPLGPTAKVTGLGLRTNRPRVYIVAGLGGGTGSGMFLDLAFLLKHELRQVGYREIETVGMLIVPPSDPKLVSRTVQANVFAALAEMNHFATGQTYSTRFDANESPVVDGQGAFSRAALFQLSDKQKPKEIARCVGLIARGMFLDMFTPTGRTTDYVRSVAPVDPYSGPTVQPFGVYRLSWPRPEMLTCITRRFCQQLLKRWTDKETTHLREPITYWLTEQWTRYQLSTESLLDRFQKAVGAGLRESPEAVFDAAIEPLRTRTPGAGRIDAMAAVGVLEQLIKLVGKPDGDGESTVIPALTQYISGASQQASIDAETHLATVAVSFLEQPQYRLAGAEEGLNQITARLKSSIETLENLRVGLAREVSDTYSRLFPLIGGMNSSSSLSMLVARKGSTTELLELLSHYPRKRYRLLVLDAALTFYRGLLCGIPDYLRDVNFCRSRLETISQNIVGPPTADPSAEPSAFILPVGCATLEAAADQFIAGLPPDDIIAYDQQLQDAIKSKFRGLTTVCLKPDRAAGFPDLLMQSAKVFLDARLEHADPAEALTKYRGDGPECATLLTQAFEEAAPHISFIDKRQHVEGTILAAPAGPSGERLRRLALDANPGIEFIPADLPDEVVIVREYPRVPISELAQLGPAGHDAYHAQLATEQPPHARTDVSWVAPMKPAAPR